MMHYWAAGRVLASIFMMYSHYTGTIALSTSIKFQAKLGGQMIQELVYLEKTSPSIIECAALCVEEPGCVSASYDYNSGSCWLSEDEIIGPGYQNKLIGGQTWTTLLSCPVGWVRIGQSCYLFHQERKIYAEAKAYCENVGGKLAEPQTNASFEALRNYMVGNIRITFPDARCCHWFGLTDEDEEGRFKWNSNGVETSYTAWGRSTEPNGGTSSNCVHLVEGLGFRWSDKTCGYTNHVICEI